VITLLHVGVIRSDALVDIYCPVYIANVMDVARRATGAGFLKFTKDVAHFYLDSRYASLVGLIVNELVANAIEHAFLDNRDGEVRVALRQVGANVVELLVSDDGVGLPGDIKLETVESMGLRLVSMLADQLGGTIDVSRAAGTSFTVRFALQGLRSE
jgi:two-component sensor histidine kinase